MSANNVELIQQWQALGKVPPELLGEEAFKACKKAGLTSLQSYVCWAEVEKFPDVVDFSAYDEVVEKLRKHGLKWVPFLILGPYYATPAWFQKTNESVYAKCLEHGLETKIQSIWNPHLPKYVDRFLWLFSKHYKRSPLIKSVQLGICGNWGEALFPTTGGFSPLKDFHMHPGWWCGDKYAIHNFQSCMRKKYGSIKKLNAAWGKRFSKFEEIDYPEIKPSFVYWCIDSWKALVKFGIKTLVRKSTSWDKNSIGIIRLKYPRFQDLQKDPHKRRRWLDFVHWYLGSMGKWAEFWIKTARKYFPTAEIYLTTGGDGDPILGADFSAQARIAAKYKAGLWVTNQEDDYVRNFSLGRLVASASRHYKTYFTTEEAWYNSPIGVVARIFDAATSGAKGIYFKDIIGGVMAFVEKHCRLGEPTQNMVSFVRNVRYLTGEKPIVEAAVLFPNISITLNPLILRSVYAESSQLRDVLDFNFVDENMINDNALQKYLFLILLDGTYARYKTLVKIEDWVSRGGILVSSNRTNLSAIEGGSKLHEDLSLRPGIKKVGCGYGIISRHEERDYLEFINQVVYNRGRSHPWKGILEIDDEWDGIYATRFSDKILYFNPTKILKTKHVRIENAPRKIEFKIRIAPHSIAGLSLTAK